MRLVTGPTTAQNDDGQAGARDAAPSPSASAYALDRILALIGQGVLTSGAQLPPERDLSLQLGVSRSSIREATSALVALGLLEARRGAGVFATPLDADHLVSALGLTLPLGSQHLRQDAAELVRGLEAWATSAATARATGETIADLELRAEKVERAEGREARRSAEHDFHQAVAAASGNELVAALLEALSRTTDPGPPATARVEDAESDHRRLLAALRARDPEQARSAAGAHSRLDALAWWHEDPTDLAETTDTRFNGARESDPRPVPGWWRDAKLGVIVHWGLYSVPGWAPLDDALVEMLTDEETMPRTGEEVDPIVRHCFAEWYQNGQAIPGSPTWRHHQEYYGEAPYSDFRTGFAEGLRALDTGAWAEQFAAAGARYVVLVAKHHDGYLLWPASEQNPKVPDWTAPRDVVGDVADAVRERGLKVGVYYSSGIDWTFDSLPISRVADVRSATPQEPGYTTYVSGHWRDLITRYSPDVLWNDMGYPDTAAADDLIAGYYEAVPEGIVTDRFGASHHDVATPNYARRHTIDPRPWESVRPLGLSFGWNRQETANETLSGREVVHLLLDVVSKNGNLLLGVSPDHLGRIPAVQQQVLTELGAWLERHGRGVYGTRPWMAAEATTADGVPVRFTCSSDTLYVHLLGDVSSSVTVLGLTAPQEVSAAQVGGPALGVHDEPGGVRFDGLTPDPLATTIAVPLACQVRAEAWGAPRLGR
jgi:alpha-L-fucosidase/DNA-binding FadR family transcriptional regulator